MRSFVTSLVAKDEIGLLYSVIGFFGSLGVLICTPLGAAALSWGLKKGGLFVGTPFFIAFILYFISSIFTWIIYVPEKISGDWDEDEEISQPDD
jgi:hypothetical protein